MPWITRGAYCAATGLSPDAVGNRGRRGSIKRRRAPDGGSGFEYLLEGAGPSAPESLDDLEVPGYLVDTARGSYLFPDVRAMGGESLVVSREKIESAVEAYSNDGAAATINELCRKCAWTRGVAIEVLRRLGFTHDSLPFTPEAIEGRDEDDLIASRIALKTQQVHAKSERALHRLVEEKAAAWDRLDQQILQPLIALGPPTPPKPPKIKPFRKYPRPFSVYATPSDLHVGKFGWALEVGDAYDIEECRRRLVSATERAIEATLAFGAPDRVLMGVGSDFFHVDSWRGTSKGTPMDTDGTVARILHEGVGLWDWYVNAWRAVAPVEQVLKGGNHDELLSFVLLHWSAAKWDVAKDVSVRISAAPRQYVELGNVLVGISHAEDVKHRDLHSLMAAEVPAAWGRCEHRVWFTGHLHSDTTSEMYGTKIHIVPSLSGSDKWHTRHGYIDNKKTLSVYVLDHELGEVAQINASPASKS